jgi:uncharacterized protein (DUF488 family)
MKDKFSTTDVTIFTVGHSNHPVETFLALLEQHEVALIVDVRSRPYSGYASDFDREAICRRLRDHRIDYRFLGDLLGGRPEGDDFYDREGYVLYDRLAGSSSFRRGIEQLLEGIENRRAALLCGEEDPTDCHRRRLIGRVLGERGVGVLHIRGDGRVQTEDEVARDERMRKTKGQLTLFDLEEAEPWKSTRSVLRRKPSL